MRGSTRSSYLAVVLAAIPFLLTPGAGLEATCAGRGGPAATLLVPYFEVALEDPGGTATLFSVANADSRATVARAVLWTNLGIPTLGFDVLIAGDGVVTVNLRDVFAGRLPVTGDGPEPPVGLDPLDPPAGCTFPLALPDLGGQALADLRARHTGKPSSDGLCHSEPVKGGLAIGYVTVDVMDGCLPEGRVPGDGEPYFIGEGSGGLAAERNVLWGDVFLIDSAGNRAEGLRAVSVPADSSIESWPTFYGNLLPGIEDRRLPLPSRHRTRFLDRAGTRTSFVVWTENFGQKPTEPVDGGCELAGSASINNASFPSIAKLSVRGWSERSDETFDSTFDTWRRLVRIPVGDGGLSVPLSFGSLELSSRAYCPVCDPTSAHPSQAWVGTLIEARRRYAVGVEAIGLGTCR